MVMVGLKPDLDDDLASFYSGWVIWPVKTAPEMTYNDSSGTLRFYSLTGVTVECWAIGIHVPYLLTPSMCRVSQRHVFWHIAVVTSR